ncbi:hypothetical protein IWW38_002661, partial [Coemansia aciculifera]
REKGVVKKFQPTYAVLTKQGYLHCYAEQKDLLETSPDISFHLSDCSVSLPEDSTLFVVSINDKKLGRSKYLFRASSASYVDHWVNAISSASTKQQSTLESHVVGGTLRNSAAARAAAEANAGASSTLPTAAGVTAGELAMRYANEDAQAQQQKVNELPSGNIAGTPLEGEQFYAARDYVSDAAQHGHKHSGSQGTINSGSNGVAKDDAGHREGGALPGYGTPQTSAGTVPATAVTSPDMATSQPPLPHPAVSFPVPFAGI